MTTTNVRFGLKVPTPQRLGFAIDHWGHPVLFGNKADAETFLADHSQGHNYVVAEYRGNATAADNPYNLAGVWNPKTGTHL